MIVYPVRVLRTGHGAPGVRVPLRAGHGSGLGSGGSRWTPRGPREGNYCLGCLVPVKVPSPMPASVNFPFIVSPSTVPA